MSKRMGTPSEALNNLEFHASGFVVKVGGSWTELSLQPFRAFLNARGFSPSEEDLAALLARAKENFLRGDSRLFICNAVPCHTKIRFDVSLEALEHARRESGVPISLTGCQGPCKQAPLLSLRVGSRSELFAQVASSADWKIVLEFASKANAAGTLLMDAGDAEQFRFDPVHDEPKQSVHLNRMKFLVGHFQGEGKYTMTPYSFQKEVIGTLEASGRFIALRMGASYPLSDGRKDVHKALVIVGSDSLSGKITAHAYTDAGLMREYSIESGQDGLQFEDASPGHASQWKRARKILSPTQEGFEERLEVDAGNGEFVPYYSIAMRRTAKMEKLD
ncbi:MAG TPA: (2Fe-2S) ferredoxin domain-containing protein [Candidatus Binatia bacterium]|nr:(2Fe-2S) ferredoxin domain-containing protein [Candidatus Binatia bacterium]